MTDPTVTLKEHFENILNEKDKAIQAALASAEKAVTAALAAAQKAVEKAEAEAKEWRQNANEWRGAMTDKDKNLATKAEVATLKERLDLIQGKNSGLSQGSAILIGAVSLIGALLAIFGRF